MDDYTQEAGLCDVSSHRVRPSGHCVYHDFSALHLYADFLHRPSFLYHAGRFQNEVRPYDAKPIATRRRAHYRAGGGSIRHDHSTYNPQSKPRPGQV